MTSRYWLGNAPRVVIPIALNQLFSVSVPAGRVYIALATRADRESGLVDSTFEQISRDAWMTRRRAAEGVAKLIELGWIEQVRKGNSRFSSKYRLLPEPIELDSVDIDTVKGVDIDTIHPMDSVDIDTVNPVPPLSREDDSLDSVDIDTVSSLDSVDIDTPSYKSFLKTSPASSGVEVDERREDTGTLPGLLVVAPESDSKPKAKATRHGYSPEFEAFWAAYPMRRGKKEGKYPSSREWTKALKLVSVEVLMAAVKAYAASCGGYPVDAKRWLKDRLWEDHAEAASRAQAGELTDAEIEDLLGPDLEPLPELPPGIRPGTPEAIEQRARDRAERRAARLAKAITRMNLRSRAS